MSTAAPAWSSALVKALKALDDTPDDLLALARFFAKEEIGEQDLHDYISVADTNDAALHQFRLSFAAWDNPAAQIDIDGTLTPPWSHERRAATYGKLGLGPALASLLDERLPVAKKPAIVISKTFEPWYGKARAERTSVYWDHYRKYLETKGWSPTAIANLSQSTTDVVERLSDPVRHEAKRTKGLVVGYVQSGKTANFTGVTAKAIDAGYRLVIVLTGTIEILRAQTQRRLDMELIGRENILNGQDESDPEVVKEQDYLQDPDWIAGKFVSHGSALDQPGVAHVERVTTKSKDYQRLPQGLTKLRFHRFDKTKRLNVPENLFRTDAYVAVVKKERRALEKLIKDLKPIKGDLGDLPVLIIDDEADVASPDTSNPKSLAKTSGAGKKRTTINKLITEIIDLCPRAQYLGYTATPFANVFIDPDDEIDLFPSDFVLSLQRPPGYMGVQEFHDVGIGYDDEPRTVANSNEKAHVRALIGDPETDPAQRDAEMREAIDAWVLSGAIKKYRQKVDGTEFRHHTLLVHESVKTADHSETADVVRRVWRQGKFTQADGLARLHKLFEEDYLPVMLARAHGHAVPATFEDVRVYVAEAVQAMTADIDPVLVVNSDKEIQDQQKKLDFGADPVWRILVGGTQLSRGFTVEGLTVSYYRRKAGQADTLMQAGRWFGFRPGYQDLVRLYIRRDVEVDLYEAFEALLLDEESFREELQRYEGTDENGVPIVEPRQIPPLVSQHLPWLKPTARNKMYNAVIESQATAGGFQDRFGIPDVGDQANRQNVREVVERLFSGPIAEVKAPYVRNEQTRLVTAKTTIVDAEAFNDFLDAYTWHDAYADVVRPLKRFLTKATAEGNITDWVIAWPQAQGIPQVTFDGLGDARIVRRKRRGERVDYVGSDPTHRQAFVPLALGAAIPGIEGKPGRGIALVYFADPRPNPDTPVSTDDVVAFISIATPLSATPHRRDLIQWSVRSHAEPNAVSIEPVAVQVDVR